MTSQLNCEAASQRIVDRQQAALGQASNVVASARIARCGPRSWSTLASSGKRPTSPITNRRSCISRGVSTIVSCGYA